MHILKGFLPWVIRQFSSPIAWAVHGVIFVLFILALKLLRESPNPLAMALGWATGLVISYLLDMLFRPPEPSSGLNLEVFVRWAELHPAEFAALRAELKSDDPPMIFSDEIYNYLLIEQYPFSLRCWLFAGLMCLSLTWQRRYKLKNFGRNWRAEYDYHRDEF